MKYANTRRPGEDGAPASLEDAFLAITEQYMKKGGENS